MAREFRTVGVVGLGTMGAGTAEVLARAGLSMVGVEPTAEGLERASAHLASSTGRAVARATLTAEQAADVLGRIRTTTELEHLVRAGYLGRRTGRGLRDARR